MFYKDIPFPSIAERLTQMPQRQTQRLTGSRRLWWRPEVGPGCCLMGVALAYIRLRDDSGFLQQFGWPRFLVW